MDDRLNAVPCGLLSFREDGILTWMNLTLLEMLGYELDELAGRHVERLLTVGSRIFYQTHWFPLLRLHGSAEEIFLMLRSKSGEDIGALVNAVRLERGGEVEYECAIMRVRERRKYEDELLRAKKAAEQARAEVEAQQKELRRVNEQLLARTEEAEHLRAVAEEANQAKSAFLAVMSHELRTPLNAIAGYIQILDMGIHGPVTDAQRETFDRIDRSQRHLLRLINDVLNLARIESGRVEYVLEDIPVGEIVGAVTPMIEPQLRTKGVAFAVDIAPDLVVRADREKLQQILLNLLSNAVKFTPGGGRVRVDAVRSAGPQDRLLLRVGDTGIGIPAEKLDAVFEPFVQVDTSRTRGEEGTGLGLAISRDLSRGMGGELTVESTPGEGSTFTIVLPLA